jgi:hypothetical protein
VKETSDAANGTVGKSSTSESNERFSERRGGQVIDSEAGSGAAGSRPQGKESSNAASGPAASHPQRKETCDAKIVGDDSA